uniref:Probable nicotinate-nucleotide pyrophosphorylase [carboxylating] n=1 Tax=Cyanothece sp. (strain PCC 7425 / ATCC 29141) TaxID=395961 RepID=B8HY49_CYAP4
MHSDPCLPPWLLLDPLLENWIREDLGRGDRTTQAICADPAHREPWGQATIEVKQAGIIAGLPLALRVFQRLDQTVQANPQVKDGTSCKSGTVVAQLKGDLSTLLMGERVALNLLMRLSGIATLTRHYTDQLADLPTCLVDTRKTTPGLRLLEKYATAVGGAVNHRFGLDDAVMIKDNHILAAGGIGAAIDRVRQSAPFPLTIEVETETLEQVQTALEHRADIIMLDNMPLDRMQAAVQLIRQQNAQIKIEASGNITLENLRSVATTGVDYISTSALITRAPWLDCSLSILQP